ncbi:Alpha/Beta hydrolase protein [Armillaria novae-zelandiae]|uniref:Alpha/Beta hydrolase protein n=1 Tax=Armillaria novae-zelandiae TaxID=153914 RepID=A0AA39U025_9AGAR|nr:Alpha/Beta hydrolase protein [Armillaria novae-zelandiae]
MTSQIPILAGGLGECCFTAVRHEGAPAGKVVTISGVPTYVSEPQTAKTVDKTKVVLFLADVYGPLYINNQLVQDYFASQGFIVVGVDYFLGDPVYIHTEPDFDRPAWLEKSKHQARELMPGWVNAIREKYGEDTQYSAVGYCFGAPFVLDLAACGDIVAGAIVHPAFLTKDHFKNIKRPVLLSCAGTYHLLLPNHIILQSLIETDRTFPLESRRRAEDILIEIKASYCFQVFSGVKHGFALRGNPMLAILVSWAKEESARGIANWIHRFCTEASQSVQL